MTEISQLAADMLRQGRRGLAEWVCSRLEAAVPPGDSLAASTRYAVWVQQVESHIHTLAACIAYSSPALLEEYVRWATGVCEQATPLCRNICTIYDELVGAVRAEYSSEVLEVVERYVDRAHQTLPVAATEAILDGSANPYAALQEAFMSSLLQTRRSDALRLVLQALEGGTSLQAIYLDVMQPTLYRVGQLWQSGDITVAQEHYATAATQFVMSQLQPYFLAGKPASHSLISTCVGDELHEVGLRVVTDMLEMNGWNTIYLGANAPARSIANALTNSGAEMLVVSTTMTRHLFTLSDLLRTIRTTPGCEAVKVLVGGYPFNVDPFLWEKVGGDGTANNALEAIEVAAKLAGTPLEQIHSTAGESELPAALRLDWNLQRQIANEDDLTRLNNNLITLQRQLHQANLQLAKVNQDNLDKAEELQRADRRKDEFLAMLAHELRGPLAPMELAVDLLHSDELAAAERTEARATMKRQLHQMRHLISDLLDASRIVHGKIELKRKRLDLGRVVRRAVEIAQPLIDEKRHRLHVNLSDRRLWVQGDEIRLTQVVANLLTNAAKYTPAGGEIWLESSGHGDNGTLEVRDNGVGIEIDLLPDVFQAFTQEQRSHQHSRGGLGLGLSLVQQIVQLHGGQVEAHSDGAGEGSRFVVTLPIEADTEEPRDADNLSEHPSHDFASQIATEQNSAEERMRRVLIVEDTAGIARMTAILFEKLGQQPIVAFDGATALKDFEELRPELVILDLNLPDMSGLEVMRQMRRLEPETQTLLVALTGHGDEQHRQQAAEAGCDEYLVKPVDIRDLMRLVDHPKLTAASSSS
ncbi:ATP-binding protein [Roseimaritima sediminicola]|uniref:ATP-binding protein n=1 Tax=Roseimaritima sediminicola TaxID=2662066 RepID=UPI001298295F|nr:ATP-binding protein [Roseimaritima sediminicola]